MIWWVVSRPTASLTPHQTGCEYLSDSLACWSARRCFVQIVFYTLYWCSFCFWFESLSTLALGDNSEWFFMILRAPLQIHKAARLTRKAISIAGTLLQGDVSSVWSTCFPRVVMVLAKAVNAQSLRGKRNELCVIPVDRFVVIN